MNSETKQSKAILLIDDIGSFTLHQLSTVFSTWINDINNESKTVWNEKVSMMLIKGISLFIVAELLWFFNYEYVTGVFLAFSGFFILIPLMELFVLNHKHRGVA